MEKNFKKIGWITISSKLGGGNTYGAMVRKALCKDFDIELKNLEARWVEKHLGWRYFKPFEWVFRFLTLRGEKDLWITQSFSDLALLPLNRIKGKKLAIIYHIDNSIFSLFSRFVFFPIEKIFYHKLKKVDAIVVISNYWQRHFLDRGYSNVYKIYSGFPVEDFNITDREILEFKKEHGLEGRPIVYIGNCQKAKGVVEAYEALKDLDVHLVTSGEERVKIPARNFCLDRPSFLKLLKASTIAVFMTRFNTGWDTTAHEAMFFKRPVIGSEKGAMREFLEGAGQIVCEDFGCLREKVKYLLSHPEERELIGEKGYYFAKDFTEERFEKEWVDLVKKIV